MLSDKKARHFHAGKLRKEIDGVEYVEVAESNGKVFVGRNGLVTTPKRQVPWKGTRSNLELNKVPVVATDWTGHRIEFPSLKEGARVTGASRCCISRVLHGFLKTAGGYKWEVLHG